MKALSHAGPSLIRNGASRISAYMATLYYLEIIALMFGLLFLYGKTASIVTGAVLTPLLTIHIIRLYMGYSLQRKIQLFLIDIHAAFAAGFLVHALAQSAPIDLSVAPVLIMRTGILACELPLLIFLTVDEAPAS